MVESLRSSAAARSKRVLVQSQPSSSPVPIFRPRLLACSAVVCLFFSYSARVGARFEFALLLTVAVGTGVLVLAFKLVFLFPFTFSFAVSLQAVKRTAMTNIAMIPKNLSFISADSSCSHNSSENVRPNENPPLSQWAQAWKLSFLGGFTLSASQNRGDWSLRSVRTAT